jgi:hypothetical protein
MGSALYENRVQLCSHSHSYFLRSKTRIVSGCTPEETRRLRAFHSEVVRRMSDRFHIHFTPDFSAVKLQKGVHPFKYMNKPLRAVTPESPLPASCPGVLTPNIVLSLQVWCPRLDGAGSGD